MNARATCILFSLLALSATAQPPEDGMFPFVMPWDDASPGIVNLGAWNEAPAGAKGHVSVRDGHLSYGGRRLRLWGTNLTFRGCFPEHREAERAAARMARLGINAVRFHHMDMFPAPTGIFRADMRTLDTGQLDRLDYFIHQLKRHGIFTNLNLHVGRTYPGMPTWEGMPDFHKGVDLFYPPMIEMQREYARDLLRHRNPYTGAVYAEDPAVAIVEINNENGLLMYWHNGGLDDMPEPFRLELGRLWNGFLRDRYRGDATALRRAWDARDEPPGPEALRNAGLADGGQGWNLEQHGGARAEVRVVPDGPDGAPAARIRVSETGGEAWHVQWNQAGLKVEEDGLYTLTFEARADRPRRIMVNIGQAHDPWNILWSRDLDLAPDRREFRFTFRLPASDDNARLCFSGLGREPGDTFLSGLSLRPGGRTGAGQDVGFGDIPILLRPEYDGASPGARKDWVAFLWETEERYWTGMARYLKDDLKVKGLVVGTAAGFSPALIQARLDAVDAHAYWQHPHFPNRPWDAEDWTVRNVPMAGAPDGGTIPDLARYRVAGKPFMVTEYNHPAPSTYSSEAFTLLAAYAALQDWDAVFQFDYGAAHAGDEPGRIPGFFAMDQHPTKLAAFHAAAALFRRADLPTPEQGITIAVTPDMALDQAGRVGPWFGVDSFGVPRLAALRQPVAMALAARPNRPHPTADLEPPHASADGALVWDRGRVTLNTVRSRAFIGEARGEGVDLGGVRIEAGSNRQDWAAISLTVMEGRDFRSPGRILITATGDVQNTGMLWKDATRNSVGSEWGRPPTLVEGIPAGITLPVEAARVRAWALDARGIRRIPIPVEDRDGRAGLTLGPAHRTLWYEVVIR